MDAKAWDERYAATDLIWSSGPNQFVEVECADLPAGRALDLAAGEGRNAIWLAQHGWQVTAVDFAQAGLDKGRRLAGDAQIDWVCGDAVTGRGLDKLGQRESLDHRGFDLVVIAYLQLTASERRAALRRAYSLLRAGGTFLLVAHDSTNLTEGTGGPQEPDVLMTAADVLGDLAGEDFEVVRAERVARLVGASDGEERTAYDALVRLVRRT
ncbi:class I SAM-dependent methyltransferase [Nocardioides sp.]|uniref:class I SAM-dependent methyltransferase n=1 Tax=Nocardioides sp. TaxID=35761 RepID=UPI003D136CD6